MQVTVVICARNPHPDRLRQVLDGLLQQTLPAAEWELLLVDNDSREPLSAPEWPAPFSARVVRESRAGLFYARLCALAHARTPFIVFIDDDTVPDRECLRALLDAFAEDRSLAAAGPRILPAFTLPPPAWIGEFSWALAIRDLGNESLAWTLADGTPLPHFTPIGAGLAIRRSAIPPYLDHVRRYEKQILARSWIGQGRGGNEDKDLVLTLIRAGGRVGYVPRAILRHLIPEERTDPAYFEKLLPGLGYLWMRTLDAHGLNNHPPISRIGCQLRILRSWLLHRAWRRPVPRLRWLYACGRFRGLAANRQNPIRYAPPQT